MGLRIRTTQNGVVVVVVDGPLDLDASPALRETLNAVVSGGTARIVVDMSGVDTIDSTALSVLISGLKAARKNGGDLRIASPSERVITLLKLAGLDRIFNSEDTAH